MPRRSRRTAKSRVGRKSIRRTGTARAKARAVPRRAARVLRRGGSVSRQKRKVVKQRATQRIAERLKRRPRPKVRPVARPQVRMPRKPAPTPKAVRHVLRPRAVRARPRRPVQTVRQPGPSFAETAAILGALALNAASAHPDIAEESYALQDALEDLNEEGSFGDIQADLIEIDSDLNHALNLLESARDRGYRYQRDLEEIAHQAASQWQVIRDPLEVALQQELVAFQTRVQPLNDPVQQLNANLSNPKVATPLLHSTLLSVNDLRTEAQHIHGRLEGRYAELRSLIMTLNQRLTQIHWALEQLDEGRFELESGEDLVMAVQARWDQSGDEDPEGVLFLSNKRTLFERKEKQATKKVLFITVASELVQELLFDRLLADVQEVQAASKGLFGHQDFLEIRYQSGDPEDVVFHINGQDSKDWAELIERARTGKLAEDRVTGAGLSVAALSGPLTQADLVALQAEVNSLQDEMMLKEVLNELEDLENDVRGLERQLGEVRSRGYAVESHLEADVMVLTTQWERIKSNAQKTLEHQTRLLGEQMQGIQKQLSNLMGMAGSLAVARPAYMRVKSAIASAEAQADAAEDTVLTQYDAYDDEVEALQAHLDWVEWMLDALATATFKLYATESGVAATEAVWKRPNAEPENGVLFLTDQRLLWEDRVGDFELKLEVPLQQILDVKSIIDPDEAVEILQFSFDVGAPLPKTDFRLGMPVGESWLNMIGRARSGDYATGRAIELAPEELSRIQNAPNQCPNCGAALTAPILRGQAELMCEYCGVATRL